MATERKQEVIVIKKKIAPEAHSGSAWKVAYADFVTAMMAFFLLLWLLNATTEDQKQGLRNYFEPAGATKGSTGSGGLLGGISATDPGPIEEAGRTSSQSVKIRSQVVTVEEEDISQGDPSDQTKSPNPENLPENTDEQRQFIAAKAAIRRAMEQVPELSELHDSLAVDITEQGLRIRLMNHEKHRLFEPGGTELNKNGTKLLKLIAQVVERLPNKILVTGHTAEDDEVASGGVSNWTTSIKRAYAGRRGLALLGTPDQRFIDVRGRASRHPVAPGKSNADHNRRIEFTLLRHKPEIAARELIPPSLSGRR